MIEDLKVLFTFCLIAVVSAVIRFKSATQAIIDTMLGFIMGYIMYLCLDFTELSAPSKSGMACAVILWSRPLYDTISAFISKEAIKFISKRFGERHDRF